MCVACEYKAGEGVLTIFEKVITLYYNQKLHMEVAQKWGQL